jgi:hypothetical protein
MEKYKILKKTTNHLHTLSISRKNNKYFQSQKYSKLSSCDMHSDPQNNTVL